MLAYDYPFDACQLPLSCFDGAFRSFETQVLPELVRRKIAPIGMKSLGGRGEAVKKRVVTAEDAVRYAMSLPVATLVSGIDSQAVLRQNLKIARGFTPMSGAEMHALRSRLREFAGDGRFELYKTSMQHEGPIGRRQHGFPAEGQWRADGSYFAGKAPAGVGTIDRVAAMRHWPPSFTSIKVLRPFRLPPPEMFVIANAPSTSATVGAIIRTRSTLVVYFLPL